MMKSARKTLSKQYSLDSSDEEDQSGIKKLKTFDLSDLKYSSNQQISLFDGNRLNYQVSIVETDLIEILNHFKKFKMFSIKNVNGRLKIFKPINYIETLESYLIQKYGRPEVIIEHFYSLIDEELYSWYFNLDNIAKSTFHCFKSSFLDYTKKLEYDEHYKSSLNKTEYFNLLKVSSEPTDCTIWSFLKNKSNLLKKLYPNIEFEDSIKMCITSLHDFNLFKKLDNLNSNPKAIEFVVKQLDETSNSGDLTQSKEDEIQNSNIDVENKEIKNLKIEVENKNREIKKLNEAIDLLKEQLQSSEKEKDEIKEECERLKNNNDIILEQNKSFKSTSEYFKAQYNFLKNKTGNSPKNK